ncbi:hypothetical protein BBJ28_00011159 [Nothophytophthora sp. Chile5]|nr:hypothetical protein BBJ28_00011159 [Nothophytophthora sp. Chile5]
MGVIKKTALLGASAPPEKSGSSVIEGDRKLLSHYGSASTKQLNTSTISARRSNIRQNLIARGLARQYEGQKAREDVYKGQVPRYERQRRILESYHRQQTRHAADERLAEPKSPGSGEDDDEFSENVVLVLRKRTTSAPSKSSTRSTRHMSPIVPPKGAMSFPRNTSLRQLTENQQQAAHEELAGDEKRMRQAEAAAARLKGSPSEADIARVLQEAVALPSSCVSPRTPADPPFNASTRPVEPQQLNANVPGAPAAWLSAANRSSMIVLCELNVAKEIVLREQVIQQLQLALPIVDVFARDLLKLREEKAAAEAVVGAARVASPSRLKKMPSMIGITSTTLLRIDAGDAQHAVVEAEKTVAKLAALSQELAAKARLRVRQVETLLGGLQLATLSVVEGIVEWRRLRQQQRKRSNFQHLLRFPRKQRKIANYLLHLSDDLRSLFPSTALELLLGPQARFNPLLLSRKVLQLIGMPEEEGAWTTRTFLTERQSDGFGDEAAHLTGQLTRKDARRSSGGGWKSAVLPEELPLLYGALANALNAAEKKVSSPVKLPTAASEHQTRLRRCLEAISHEKELEALDKQRHGEDEQRLRGAYDPFSGIKAAGGVEETLTSLMELQSPKAPLLGEQLRFRQENAASSALASAAVDSEGSRAAVEVLQVNSVRLRQLLEQRMEQHESATDCELLSVQRWGVKNKLRGQVMVRKINTRRFEHYLARKIQLQYLVHRTRRSIQSNLTRFVQDVRVSVINIQRVFRGHQAKCEYESMKQMWLEQRRRMAAVRTIANTFRRYRRRQRHRRSMTVESVAQVQLMTLLETRLHDASETQQAAERYRRVGEERRRQRIVLLQKHKMEQQALERKRMTAAVRLQSVVRSHLAQGQARALRQEKKAHMTAVSAMTIQSKIRKFLDHQQERRRRFQKDLERVNQSAVRIQSIYRGYNSRASLLGQLDERMWQTFNRGLGVSTQHEDGGEEEGFDEDESEPDDQDEDDASDDQSEGDAFSEGPSGVHVWTPDGRLPPLVPSSSRPSSSSNSTEDRRSAPKSASHSPVSLPPLQMRAASSSLSLGLATTPSSGSRPSISSLGMTRTELKLKEPVIGDDFATPPSRRNSFVGRMQRQ